MSHHADFHALIGRLQGEEICPTGQGGDPKKSSRTPLKHPRRTNPKRRSLPLPPPALLRRRNKVVIRLHHLAKEPRRGPRPPLPVLPPRRRPLRLALRRGRRPETHPQLHLWPSHHRPLTPLRSPGEAASINLNHRPRHQVKPHPQTLVPPLLRPHMHLPLRLRALVVLEDACGPCLKSHRDSSRRP